MKFLRSPLLFGILSLILIAFAQQRAEADLFVAWQTEEYSHGMLIPLIALLIAWHRLAEAKPAIRPSWLGILFIAAGGALQLVSRLSAFMMVAQYGLILEIAGLGLAFFGRRAVWAMAPALFYLVFAVPLPHLAQATLSQDLQLLSSTIGVGLLDLGGIPVFQEGNVIDLGGYHLQVVEACSGLRYLFPMMSFSYLAAFLLKDRMWKRAIIFLSAIPITIFMNSLRISFIGLTVDLWGIKMAEGAVHAFEGWVVFLVSAALLMGEAWLLRHIGAGGHFRYEYFGPARGPLFSGLTERTGPWLAAFISTAALAAVFGLGLVDERTEIRPYHPPLASFPVLLGDWHGQEGSLPADVLKALELSDYWLADYKRPADPAPVNLYIAYYASQRVGTTTHSPSNCIPGGGWKIDSRGIRTVNLADGAPLRLTRLVVRRGEDAQVVYYWFDERGRDLTETTIAKWYLLQDSVFMHRTDGALVRLVTPLIRGESEEAADKRLGGFLIILYPQIGAYIPGATTAGGIAVP